MYTNLSNLIEKYLSVEFIKKNEYALSFFFIILAVTIANISAVFGLDVLFQDDNARYYAYVNDQYEIAHPRSFIGLLFLLKWVVVVIFSTYSAELARLFILLAYMVPTSCLFYYFNRKYLHLSIWVSLASAIIINAIPRQFFIPTFLDGSYPTSGMLFFIITLIITARYLNSSHNNKFLLIAASVGWLLVCDLVAEMGIFLFPIILYYVYSSKAEIRKKLFLYLSISAITSLRLYVYFQSVGASSVNKPADLSISVTAFRILHSIEWWLPTGRGTTTVLIFASLIVAIFIYIYIKSRNTTSHNENNVIRAVIFYGIWFISCSFPFWFFAKYFGPRNLYVSYFALTTITLIGVYQIFILPKSHKRIIATISLLLVVSLYVYQRNISNAAYFKLMNKKNDEIYSLLHDKNINDNTQIALVNIDNGTGGFHRWSSGYLKYLLKNPAINGVMGKEKNFYDPFNMNHCYYVHRMSCLNTNKELIAFKKMANKEIMQMNYFLKWKKEGSSTSEWAIYYSDKKNRLSLVKTGVGIDSYISTLSEINVGPEQVLWGNHNNKKALEKLSP